MASACGQHKAIIIIYVQICSWRCQFLKPPYLVSTYQHNESYFWCYQFLKTIPQSIIYDQMKCKGSVLPIDKAYKTASNPCKGSRWYNLPHKTAKICFKLSFIKHMSLSCAYLKDYICDICDSCDWTLSEWARELICRFMSKRKV